ncbi:ATP-binding protein [Frigidibacter sp. RF13]|uniref:ATP-binding protein n=1 Tax=Frigidibacter sp. RF13 TaxID=2997340 RepID=UPI002271E754|nr:ATP-binding protein [Frigidibacter sp. RF13]MCY1126640.1 ATP-binding protein [Frigidibacter sp. RF13]
MQSDATAHAPDQAGESARFRLQASEREVRRVLGRIMAHLGDGLAEPDRGTVEIVLAEVLNNIVEHAYARCPPGRIRLFLTPIEEGLACRVEDDGHPMPSLVLPDGRLPDISDELDLLPEGGWGWSLIRSLTADLIYERTARANRLTFRIPVSWKACRDPDRDMVARQRVAGG